MGTITSASSGTLSVDFDGRGVVLKGEQLNDIELAYAISIHKSQGSEYPAVVVALHRAHFVMLRRNLVYTAVTRAKRFCCLVGDRWAVRQAIGTAGAERAGLSWKTDFATSSDAVRGHRHLDVHGRRLRHRDHDHRRRRDHVRRRRDHAAAARPPPPPEGLAERPGLGMAAGKCHS